MNKFLKLFFVVFLGCFLVKNSPITLAEIAPSQEYERSKEFLYNSDCPDPGHENLISICGTVKRTVSRDETLTDGKTVASLSQRPVKGVSVYLYEIDNTNNSSGKNDGKLINLFASTSTNEDGKFHLIARKLDNGEKSLTGEPLVNTEEEGIPVQTKIRHLVFRCGSDRQGVEITPSYIDRSSFPVSVNCSQDEYEYIPPPPEYEFVEEGMMVAPHIGSTVEEYPGGYEDEVKQVYFSDKMNPQSSRSVNLSCENCDFRFTTPDRETGKESALNLANLDMPDLLNIDTTNYCRLGAYYSSDCLVKYQGTPCAYLCAGAVNAFGIGVGTKGDNYSLEDIRKLDEVKPTYLAGEYESRLYNDPHILVQPLLPNLPPKDGILYFKPLEVSADVTDYVQDYSNIARSIGLHYSNAPGEFRPRMLGSDLEQELYDCEFYKKCDETINYAGGIRNSLTCNGPSKALASPVDYKNLIEEMDPETPVCIKDGDYENPILYGEIEPPYSKGCEGYKLCKEYWSYDFIMLAKPEYSGTVLQGQAQWSPKTTYYPPGTPTPESLENVANHITCDGSQFEKQTEGDGTTVSGCTAVSLQSNGRPYGALMAMSNGTTSNEAFNDLLSPPGGYAYEDIVTEPKAYRTVNPAKYSLLSRTNDNFLDNKIKEGSDDEGLNFNNYFEGNASHYPLGDLLGLFANIFGIDINSNSEDKRTRYSAIFTTSAGAKRTEANAPGGDVPNYYSTLAKDKLDAVTSAISGQYNKILWPLASVQNIMLFLSGNSDNRTYFDKDTDLGKPIGMIEGLKATGFGVTEGNIKSLYIVPSKSSGLDPEDWGPGNACYGKENGWNTVPTGSECNTYQGQLNADNGEENLGADKMHGVSRTCRVKECWQTYAEVECQCTRKFEGDVYVGEKKVIAKPVKNYSYEKWCPDNADFEIITEIGEGLVTQCNDVNSRLWCAQEQESCYENSLSGKECIIKQHGGVEGIVKKAIEALDAFSCGSDDFDGESDNEADIKVRVETPSCVMQTAGPNLCDGSVIKDETISTKQQVTDLTDSNNIIGDRANTASIELSKMFKSPADDNITRESASFESVKTSYNNSGVIDTNKYGARVSATPGVGGSDEDLRGSIFAEPSEFGPLEDYEPLYIHCQNSFLNTTLGWNCNFTLLPKPEILQKFDITRTAL